jgi:DNA-binding IclR family transcriptional regulator
MTQEPDSGGVAAVDRAIAILRAVARVSSPVTLADLARATGYYKSTLLRLLASLERSALVVRRSDGRYALGTYAHELGRAYEATYRLSGVLTPLLNELVEQGSESASFHVYHDREYRVCLLRIDSHHSTLDRIDVGDLLPLNRGAAGKLITTFRGTGVAPSASSVLETSIGERDPDCAAVAAAVFGTDNEFLGALSLSGPKERFTDDAIARQSGMILDAARRATEMLGGRWPTR